MISVLPRVEASPRSPTLVLPLRVSEHPRRHRERGGQGLPSSLFDCQRPRDITLDFIQSKPLEDACCESRLRTHDRCAHVRGRLRRVNISLICTNLSMRGRRREVASHDARRVSFSLRVCCYCANVSRDSVKRFYMNMLFCTSTMLFSAVDAVITQKCRNVMARGPEADMCQGYR